MNCEKCKNKKATLFYADEGGIQHALCASCGESLNKISKLGQSEKSDTQARFIPEKTLNSFFDGNTSPSLKLRREASREAVCSVCKSTLEDILRSGRFGCPSCYECFEEYFICIPAANDCSDGVRMPHSRRADIDRRKTLDRLRAEIKTAVEGENYELAASLRDKMKKIELKLK